MPITRKVMSVKKGRVYTGALTYAGTCAIRVNQLPQYMNMSKDGANLYTIGNYDLDTFTRNTTTGALTLLNTITMGASFYGVCVSSDGKNVYILNLTNMVVRGYTRNTSTGILTYLADYALAYSTNLFAYAIDISPDGNSVYVWHNVNGLNHFSRNSTTGALTLQGTYGGPNDGFSMAFPRDSSNLYLHAYGSIYPYTRNITTGALTTLGSTLSTRGDKRFICCSFDGNHVYASNGHWIYIYSRNTSTGLLTFITSWTTGYSIYGLAISPDGVSVYISHVDLHRLNLFTRNASTGLLTDTGTISAVSSPSEIKISEDGANVYVGSLGTNVVVIFNRT